MKKVSCLSIHPFLIHSLVIQLLLSFSPSMFSTCGLTGLLGTLYLFFPTIAGLEAFTGLFGNSSTTETVSLFLFFIFIFFLLEFVIIFFEKFVIVCINFLKKDFLLKFYKSILTLKRYFAKICQKSILTSILFINLISFETLILQSVYLPLLLCTILLVFVM